MKNYLHLLLPFLLLVFFGCKEKPTVQRTPENKATKKVKPSLIMSNINKNFVVQGSYINTFFAIPNPNRDKITFQKTVFPKDAEAFLQQKGISNIIIHPTQVTDTPIVTKIFAESEWGMDSISFTTKVTQPVGSIFYAAPKNSKQIGQKIDTYSIQSLEKVLKRIAKENIRPATIFLMSGHYPTLHLDNFQDLTIIPKIEESPVFPSIQITHSQKCTLQALTIASENPKGKNSYYVKIDSTSSIITIRNCLIQAADKTEQWEAQDWKTKASNGIYSEGKACIFQHNLIRNIHHGIETKGNNNLVTNNIIIRFAGDAIRNTGDSNFFLENYLADALVDDYYDKDGNHDDLFQSWTFDRPIKNIFISDNIAINCTDTSIHLQSKNVQGIACFDGFEENWKIQNNLVIVEHPHGIALFGAQNCQIQNNKIIPNPFNKYDFESAPWIMIHDHKDGRKSHNNQIINNLVSVLKIDDSTAVIKDNTIIDSIPDKTFPNYTHWIFQ